MEIVLSHQQFNFTDIKSRLQTQSLLRDIAPSFLLLNRTRRSLDISHSRDPEILIVDTHSIINNFSILFLSGQH